MKRFLIAFSIVFWSLVSYEVNANPIDDSCPQHVVWGAPQIKVEGNNQYLCKLGYAVNYNYTTKVSYFVAEHLIATNLVKNTARKDDFREDTSIPTQYRATLLDYQGSGLDRGHMAPAANFTYAHNVMSESFFLTNMMPQVPGNNRGIWKYLEEYTRYWAQKRGDLYIITGTIYDKSPPKIMGNGVKVPPYLYKIVIDANRGQSISFMFPNEKLDPKTMEQYIVSIGEIEDYTGINFSPLLPAKLQALEKNRGIMKDWE